MSSQTTETVAEIGIRYENTRGALVVIVQDPLYRSTEHLVWACMGCRDVGPGQTLAYARKGARDHGASCTALPPAGRSPLVPVTIGVRVCQVVEGGSA